MLDKAEILVTGSPEVHILIPARNSAEYIEHALQSALAQSYEALKVIVYDDGSVDDTARIVRALSASAPGKVHLTVASYARGVAFARNQLLEISDRVNSEAYFMWLDSDDYFINDRCVETVMSQMHRTKAEICLFGFNIQWEKISDDMHLTAAVVLAEKANHEKLLAIIEDASEQTVSIRTCPEILTGISAGWVYAYAARLRKQWPHPVEGALYEDNPPMAALLNVERITVVNQPLVNYRRRSGSATGQSIPDHFLVDRPKQLRRFMEHIDLSDPLKARAATDFVEAKLKRAGDMLDQLTQASHPGFDEDVRVEFNKLRKNLTADARRMAEDCNPRPPQTSSA